MIELTEEEGEKRIKNSPLQKLLDLPYNLSECLSNPYDLDKDEEDAS